MHKMNELLQSIFAIFKVFASLAVLVLLVVQGLASYFKYEESQFAKAALPATATVIFRNAEARSFTTTKSDRWGTSKETSGGTVYNVAIEYMAGPNKIRQTVVFTKLFPYQAGETFELLYSSQDPMKISIPGVDEKFDTKLWSLRVVLFFSGFFLFVSLIMTPFLLWGLSDGAKKLGEQLKKDLDHEREERLKKLSRNL